MKQRFNKYTQALCEQAVYACFDHKWTRADVLAYIEEYAGIDRRELYADELTQSSNVKNEAVECIALHLMDMAEEIFEGGDPEIEPVTIRPRPDGMTGKIRDIACLSIDHQLLGHLVYLGLKPHIMARLLPQQHASVPGRGQTKLMRQTRRYLRKKSLDIQVFQKTDIEHAYASLLYEVVIELLEQAIPKAKWILSILRYLAGLAPGGHLIIGGYIDAWLFNYAMSYALRYALSIGQTRRGRFRRFIETLEAYMDDVALMARTKTGLQKAIRKLERWLQEHLKLKLKITTGIIRLLSVEEEQRRKTMERPSQRGCPAIDMGGYRISRTHVTMRPRVVKRVIRTFARAWAEIRTTGTMHLRRAQAVIARYGFISQTCSDGFRRKYHVGEILHMAKKINGYWARVRSRTRKEWLQNVVSQNPVECYTRLGENRAAA